MTNPDLDKRVRAVLPAMCGGMLVAGAVLSLIVGPVPVVTVIATMVVGQAVLYLCLRLEP